MSQKQLIFLAGEAHCQSRLQTTVLQGVKSKPVSFSSEEQILRHFDSVTSPPAIIPHPQLYLHKTSYFLGPPIPFPVTTQ